MYYLLSNTFPKHRNNHFAKFSSNKLARKQIISEILKLAVSSHPNKMRSLYEISSYVYEYVTSSRNKTTFKKY